MNCNLAKTKEVLEQMNGPPPIKNELELLEEKYKDLGCGLVKDIYENLGKNLLHAEKVLDGMLLEKRNEEIDELLRTKQ